jgi:acetyl/propionyl-CoA carboxylase alpha subunit
MQHVTDRASKVAELRAALESGSFPRTPFAGCNEVLRVLVGVRGACLSELRSLPLGEEGQRLVALRHFIAHGSMWIRHFAWEQPLARVSEDGAATVRALHDRIERTVDTLPLDEVATALEALSTTELAARVRRNDDDTLRLLCAVHLRPALAASIRERLRSEAPKTDAAARDRVYLATYDLERLPATTVSEGALRYVIVADKGEMGVRAVREAHAFGAIPVVLFSETDDRDALQVRLAEKHGGFAIGLSGSFRESYGNATQIASRVHAAYRERFGERAEEELRRSALYPGYGPLAENTAAIQQFRREGIVFVGPSQDVVERAGDKRKFRAIAESIDPRAVTPGVVIDTNDAVAIARAIHEGHAAGKFSFPGRLKAANGGGGRGQMIVHSVDGIETAVETVLAQIKANGWDPGVMFEQNIPETVHLEVQVVRDRYGNTRHFGMRDCTEQRASQKIQEEAPPAVLAGDPALAEKCCAIAVRIADIVGYVGACTVELMFKDGHVYLLEMNTRIQVEHPVTEEAHRIRTPRGLVPLDLVALQLAVAAGRPIEFAQSDVVPTHVAREFRINAESFRPDLNDSRDGKRGLFVPNGGIFDRIDIPDGATVLAALKREGVRGIAELNVRFDVGFEAGDMLVNKDPTFGKLIVAVRTDEAHHDARYELLRRASLAVLRKARIEGRQVLPTGVVASGSPFATNLAAHVQIGESEMMRAHAKGDARGRHVNWVIEMLRSAARPG